MKKNVPASRPFDDLVMENLRNDPEFAKELLKVALEESNKENGEFVLQKTLKMIAEAQGIAKVAKSAGIPRESLYRALSTKGNPRLSTLQTIIATLGLRLTLSHATA